MGKDIKSESWVPTKVLADIVGTSVNNVNKIRRGARGKRSIIASKIRFAEKFLEKNLKPHRKNFDKNLLVLIQRAKEVVKE